MSYERLQPGMFDRVFNSTIGLPQQLLWRIWRAIEDDEIDLFSEKGLLDWANVPLLGIADSHKEAVMPDYMAEQLGLADKGESGIGSQLTAAVLSDPLFYMTGGLSAIGRVGKAATIASKRSPAMTKVLREAAKDKNKDVREFMESLSPDSFMDYMDTALKSLSGQSGKRANRQRRTLENLRNEMASASAEAQRRHQRQALRSGIVGPAPAMTIKDAVKGTRDRQIAIGLPLLRRAGAQWDVPRDYSNWWAAFKDGLNTGGTGLVKHLRLKNLMGLPGAGTILKNTLAPTRHLFGGLKVGRESPVALQRSLEVPPEHRDAYRQWLSPEGGGKIAQAIDEQAAKLGGREVLLAKLQEAYEIAIKQNMSHEDAFKAAFRSQKIGFKGESGVALYGRMTGRTKNSTFFPKWGAGASKGKATFEGIIDNLVSEHTAASKRHQAGLTSIHPIDTETKKLADVFEADRETLADSVAAISEASFATGQSIKAYWNKIFRTGEFSAAGEKEYATFLSNVARDNDQLEKITEGLYKKLRELTADPKATLSQGDVTKLVGALIELDGLPGEIAASFKAAQLNPSQVAPVLRSVNRYLKRQRRSITVIEKLLDKGGLNNTKTLEKIFSNEVYPFLEGGSKSYAAVFRRIIKDQRKTVEVFTPNEQTLMRRPNNAHVVTGVEMPLTSAQESAVRQGKQAKPNVLLGNIEGRQLGTLSDQEIADALFDLDRSGQRNLSARELRSAAEEMEPIQDLLSTLRSSGLDVSLDDLLLGMSKTGRAATRLIPREVLKEVPLWAASRTRWNAEDAHRTAQDWGFEIIEEEGGTLRFKPGVVSPPYTAGVAVPQISGSLEKVESIGGFRSYGEVMRSIRNTLKNNPEYRREFGPGIFTDKSPLRIPTKLIEQARHRLSDTEKLVLGGKATKFDRANLPTGAIPHLERLQKLKKLRALPEGHRSRAVQIVPTKDTRVVRLAEPRGKDEFSIYLREGGFLISENQMGEFGINYARSRLLIREVLNALRRAKDAKLPLEIEPSLLSDIERSAAATGGIIRGIMESHLPKEFTEMMTRATMLNNASFEAAKAAGVWIPGSPIGYLPRFFNKDARARISKLMGEIEQVDSSILMRLGVRQTQYFQRQWDELTLGELNAVHAELREAMVAEGATPKLRKFHADLDDIMAKSGVGISGLHKALPWTKGKRIEDDPFLALIQRFGVAQQDASLDGFFKSMMALGNGKNGESLMLGGKVIGIIDDTGNVHKQHIPSYRSRRLKQGKGLEAVVLEEVDTVRDIVPKSFMVQLDDGTVRTIENNLLAETGFGLLPLHGQTRATDLAESATSAAFVRSSMRSDLHNEMFQAPLNDLQAFGLLNKQVVLGSQNNIAGMVKAAARVHKVTAPALRAFDAINYGIKSFQTIFQLPFHVANLSSGVFQAHLAGATPKNLLASYLDTMRFMFGDQKFANHISMATDMLDVGSEVHSSGIRRLVEGETSAIQTAVRAHGSGELARFLGKQDPEALAQLDAVEDLTLRLHDGTEIDMAEFFQVCGEAQLYGTFASSLTRGSRTVGDNLLRIKINALDPTFGGRFKGAPKRMLSRWAKRAESTEVLNRTATALALVREGHPMRRAIEIAKEAHVPYEKLTPFEREAMKRFSVYYTFPRHYMPWAWTRFAEDPSKLSHISQFIRDQNIMTTQEGKPTISVGNYRLNIGRLNANWEAAGLLAAFSDRLMLPGLDLVPGVDIDNSHKLRSRFSDAGITNIGGAFSPVFGGNMLHDAERDPPNRGFFEEATTLIWPLKWLSILAGNQPTKEASSPYVQYSPLESVLTDTVYGVGLRKVRDQHELVRSKIAFQRMAKQLQLRAAATDDPEKRQRLIMRVRELAAGLQQMTSETERKIFK